MKSKYRMFLQGKFRKFNSYMKSLWYLMIILYEGMLLKTEQK
jgi:hypothetical protein